MVDRSRGSASHFRRDSPVFSSVRFNRLQIADLAFDFQSVPFAGIEDLQPVMVSSLTGLPVTSVGGQRDKSPTQMLSYVEEGEEGLVPKRVFRPIPAIPHEKTLAQ